VSEWEHVGWIGVDSGMVLIGDPTNILPRAAGAPPRVELDALIREGAPDVVVPVGSGGVLLVHRFGGDGDYPVFMTRDAYGTVSIRIDFVEPSDGEDDE